MECILTTTHFTTRKFFLVIRVLYFILAFGVLGFPRRKSVRTDVKLLQVPAVVFYSFSLLKDEEKKKK